MINSDHYTYRVTWSAEDDEYIGLVAEFPSVSWLAADHVAALLGVRAVVADIVTDMESNGEPVPILLSERTFSGEFKLRIPPELHRALALKAAEEHVSLNRLVSSKLAG
ncbi:toxin-antitoxin system HicB family antitoxin [Cryobacterium sp. CG_9.6]|uniref:type II toxin-antitoxin system HicB family antitoxin n=1 Tax=Cryobacterium sp. CG_9.6 TaxID=2760710 RepID=UPI0024764A4E|nr:toxin-antitoxin system HicB family antitoxin [Cryobacterium sp. CG_9.6]MDH6236346.1 putative HicB family RNase H-like nuclease [Cryobacterium sp. CG_9.6]